MQRSSLRLLSSFSFLNITQFLGALNDNILKGAIAFMAIETWGTAATNSIMATIGASFMIPFLLFSISAGTLADRMSKRNITVAVKFLEVLVILLAILVFWARNVWASFAILFLMGTHSALFGPSKYGIIPEIVPRQKIAKANGIMAAFTILATILGTFLASFLTEATHRNFVRVALFCIVIALVGTITALSIQYTPPCGTRRQLTPRLLRELFRVIQRARHENYLFSAMLGICAFYFIGSFAQLNIIGFGIQSLRLNEIEGGYLFVVAAVGIAVGSFLIGKICADRVEIGFAPICALLMGIILLCVPLIQHHLVLIVAALLLLGLFGGMFLVPFEAYIQAASPDSHRGENVAAGNFLSFIGMLISTGFLALLGGVFGLSAAQGFASLGIVALAIAAIQFHRFPDALVRLLSRALFPSKRERLVVQGRELFSTPFASLNICITSEWKWALLAMTALQQRYMKFLIEAPPSLSWKERWLVRLSKAVIYATPLANDEKAVAAGRNWIKRGYSLTILSQSEEPQSLALTVKSLFLDTLPQGSSLPLINASLEISDQRQIRLALTAVN